LRCSTLFTKRVVENFSILVLYSPDGRPCVGWFSIFEGFAIWNGSWVGAARVLRCSTLFSKRVVENFSNSVLYSPDGRPCVGWFSFSKALPFETGAESEQRVSYAARHSLTTRVVKNLLL
jgi:hypothetical protein